MRNHYCTIFNLKRIGFDCDRTESSYFMRPQHRSKLGGLMRGLHFLTRFALGFLVCLAAIPIATYAQTTAGNFNGIVTDPSKAVIPGAEVTATNQATGLTRTT